MTSRQMSPLPSLRDRGPSITFGRHRRANGRRLLALVAVIAGGILTLSALPPATAAGDLPLAAADAPQPAAPPAAAALTAPAEPAPPAAPPPAVFAEIAGVELHLPSEDVLLVGFHEAALPGALPLTPSGRVLSNDNTTKVVPPVDESDGPGYVVLSSRGRVQAGTSAVDLVMHDEDPVRAPVTGTVTAVTPYFLYGSHPDTRVEIAPAGRPDLRVVLIHLSDVAVAPGDELTVGQTVLAAGPNRFPFASHIDRYITDGRWPHVHVEVKEPDAPTVTTSN